jgi:hypothetical protein
MHSAESHARPHPRNLQDVVKRRSELLMIVELPKTPPPVVGEKGLPPILEAEVPLSLILANLAIDLSIGRFLLVRVFFNQGCSELRGDIWGRGQQALSSRLWKMLIPARYRSTVHHASVGGRISRAA